MTAEEYFDEAQRIFRNGQKSQAVELYRKAAYKNHSKAQLRLAQCYLNGYGVDINYRVALVWLQKAANAEDSEAEFILARCYLKGIGVAADKEQAIEWFKRAYIHGDPDAWGMLKTFGVDVKNITSDERENRLYRSHAVRFPDFDEQYILDLLNVRATYVKGRDYYAEGRVTKLSWNDDCTVFTSRVSGTYDYSCTLNFNNNRLVSHECNCPAHYNYSGPCKHIVATMFAIMNQRHDALLNKKSTAKFSFLMSIPIVLLSLVMEIYEISTGGLQITYPVWAILLSVVVAFISGVFAIKYMMRLTEKGNFKWFSLYLFLLGLVTFFI